MEKDNVVPFKSRKCKKLEEERYLEGAMRCLSEARRLSASIKDNPAMFHYVMISIRGILRVLNKVPDATLAEIGTSEEDLKSLVSPPELNFNKKEIEKRWDLVLDTRKK